MIESNESRTRDIPVWLTGIVLLLCIGGGGWLIHWYMQEKPTQAVEIPDDQVIGGNTGRGGWRGQLAGMNGGNGGNRVNRVNRNADGIQSLGRNSFQAKVGNTVMLVNSSGSNRYDFIPQYQNPRTAEEAELTMMRMSLLADANWREHLKVTEEQLKDLRNKVPAPQSLKLDAADQARMTQLWKAYQNGSSTVKATAEKNLLAAVDEIGKKHLAAFKEYEASRAQAIKAVLTPEQIKLYRGSGSKPPGKKG